MRRTWSSILGVVAVGGILVGVNMLADTRLAHVQLDVTQGRIFTLSSGTRRVLQSLKEPITLRLFYSHELGSRVPLYGGYADRVREMLAQYAALSNGKIRLEFYDPEPFSDVEDRAVGYKLQGVPVNEAGEQVYFGLAGTNLLDDERSIPFFQQERERFLEYDLTRLVYDLSNPSRPVVGVMSPLPVDGDPRMMMMMAQGQSDAGAPWASITQLRQTDTVRDVSPTTWTIDPDIKVLLVAHPQNLPEQTLYAIDQFVMRGGRLMLMVDPFSEAQAMIPGPDGAPPPEATQPSDLHRLLDAWGISYDPNQVVGDLTGAWTVRAAPGDSVEAVNYVAWFNIRDGINHDDPATADLSQVTVASPGFLAPKPGAPIQFTPLLSSSPQSALIPAAKVRQDADPSSILAGFKPQGGARVIAARVRGQLKSAFTAPPAPPAGQQRPANLPPFKAQTDGPANLVIVADSDILANRFWVHLQDFFGQQQAVPFSDNGPFVANLVGTLAGGDALIGLRGRGNPDRPFTVVDDIQRQAEARFRQTQQALQTHLQDTEKRLSALRQGDAQTPNGPQADAAILTPEQAAAIQAAQHEILDTRRQLRTVQLYLNRDIDALQMRLRLFDIALVPALLTLLAIVLGVFRRSRRMRARA
jgi:ABC-type uncharacterized transport system involved in gliding motility auxiliary subunit